MSNKLDRTFVVTAYLYLILPVILFAAGWLKWYFAIGLTAVLLASAVLCIKDFAGYIAITSQQKRLLLWTVLAVLIWVWFSGVGGFSFQNIDHEFRNAILRDLINYDWPLIYDFRGQPASHPLAGHQGALVYYVAFWLPAAIAGKLFGWQVANVALYLWTVLGVVLSFYFYLRHIGKASIVLPLIFIFWSGLDVLGFILLHGTFPVPGTHLEWWPMMHYQYSSNTTTLYWVFNQTVTTWLIVMLILNLNSTKNIAFTYILSLPFAPFSFLGLAPFVIWFVFRGGDYRDWEKNFHSTLRVMWGNIKEGLTFQNVVAAPLILAVFILYFTSNRDNVSARGWIWAYFQPADWPIILLDYIRFCFIEFGLYALLIWRSIKTEPYFFIAVASLLLIPNYMTVLNNDFVMRASMPALLVLMVYVTKYLINPVSEQQRLGKYILVCLLCIGAITPLYEMYRSVDHTLTDPDHIAADHLHSVAECADPVALALFVGRDQEESLFFKYLSPKCK